MNVTVFKEFKFCSAHHLTIPGHQCSVMHGHNYLARVHCAGGLSSETGMVVDFHEIKRLVNPIIDRLDHKCLNDIIPTGTTSEHIACWLLAEAHRVLPSVFRVDVWETDTCGATASLN
jgi:6-pyruvoyltetrahydropterin/6-carboxytetrahydropterin synthase